MPAMRIAPRIKLATVTLLAASATAAGCGGDDKPEAPTATLPQPVVHAPKAGFSPRKACDVLTPAVARQILGGAATTGSPTPETSTTSVSVTSCTYYSSKTKRSVSLLSRSALDAAGADTNEAQFGSQLPQDARRVPGLGDGAYWSPQFGQLNVLAHRNWYILSVGAVSPQDRTAADAERYARTIIDKL